MYYVGRFAPSPTGPLHAGSLVAALASFLDARNQGGIWQLRIDDIDPPREVAGATERIIESLNAHGLISEQEPLFQSRHSHRYDRALEALTTSGHVFRCTCTRATLGAGGICINQCEAAADQPASLRIRVPRDIQIEFEDLIAGHQHFTSADLPDNFIVRRRDGLYAYQLAAAVDDAAPDISHVIRGRDLLESTPRQIFIQRCLGLKAAQYGHLPVVTGSDGTKLSKQTGAAAIDNRLAADNLRSTLKWLGQAPPPLSAQSVTQILDWSTANWRRDRIPQ